MPAGCRVFIGQALDVGVAGEIRPQLEDALDLSLRFVTGSQRSVAGVLRDDGVIHVIEHGKPTNPIWRVVQAIWWLYWLPLNPETPTRRSLWRHGLTDEMESAGFRITQTTAACHGAVECVAGRPASIT